MDSKLQKTSPYTYTDDKIMCVHIECQIIITEIFL